MLNKRGERKRNSGTERVGEEGYRIDSGMEGAVGHGHDEYGMRSK